MILTWVQENQVHDLSLLKYHIVVEAHVVLNMSANLGEATT